MGSLKQEEELEAIGVEEESNQEAILYVNGVRRLLPDGLAHLTLLEYLRDIGLPGTKLGCGEGGCGACTVMVSYFDHNLKKCTHYAVNACLAPLYSVEGMHVITVEGVGNRRHGLHPVQLRWSEVLRWICHPDRRFLQTATKVWAHAMHVVGKTDIIGGGLVMATNRLFIPKRAL